jgi:hypothetical protein
MTLIHIERRLVAIAASALMLILCLPTQARADVGQTIIQHCTHQQSLSGFTQADYRRALKEISATTEEYSECGAQIRQAQEAAASGRGTGSPGTAALPAAVTATSAERKSIARAAAGALPVSLGGHIVHPGVVHADIASAFSTLPGPLLAVLAFLLACLLFAGGTFLRRRLGGQRSR